MKKYRKWNIKIHDYEDYYVPDDKELKLYTDNMNELVNCCQCLEIMRFGNGYTSLEVHNDFGLGYCVCEECYQKEWERRKQEDYENIDNNER